MSPVAAKIANPPSRHERIAQLAAAYDCAPSELRKDILLDYLYEIAEMLAVADRSDRIVSPLLDLIPFISETTGNALFKDRRSERSPPSEAVLARAALAIDTFQSLGHSPDHAAQLVARQMIHARASLPVDGSDPRGWKRLLLWHDRLLSTRRPTQAWSSYQDAARSLAALDRTEVRRRAQNGSLWDVRAGD